MRQVKNANSDDSVAKETAKASRIALGSDRHLTKMFCLSNVGLAFFFRQIISSFEDIQSANPSMMHSFSSAK